MDRSSTPKKEKKGLGRLWAKVKLAIRPKSKSKNTTSTTQASNPQSSTQINQPPIIPRYLGETTSSNINTNPESVQPPQPETVFQPPAETSTIIEPIPKTSTMEPSLPSDTAPEAKQEQPPLQQNTPTAIIPPTEKDEAVRRYERAQALFKKYDLEFDDASWEIYPKQQQVERINKNTRMRVRWTCHECKTTFGHDRTCVECAHQRCKNCVRYPPKKKKTKTAKRAALAASLPEPTSTDVRKGACHECQTAFDLGSQECSNCHHPICERCLEETVTSVEQGEAQVVTV